MKKWLGLILSAVLLVNGMPVFAETAEINIVIDGKAIEFTDEYGVPFIDNNGRTQVPLRITVKTVDADIEWDSEKGTATATKGKTTVKVIVGSQVIYVNGKMKINDTNAVIKDGRTYLPIRAILEAFSYTVSWDEETKSIVAQSGENNTPTNSSTSESKTTNSAGRLREKTLGTLPKYDPRETDAVTPVKDQLRTGTCWAFASLGAIEQKFVLDQEYDFAEDNVIYNNPFKATYTSGGSIMRTFGYLASWRGPVLESEDKFHDFKGNPDAEAVKHVQDIEFIASDIKSLKEAIAEHGAVQVSMYMDYDEDYYNEDTASFYNPDEEELNHDLILVGWDDDYSKDKFSQTPSRNGAFIAKNSWGTSWGDDGYFYLSYDDVTLGSWAVVFSRVDGVNNYDQIYQYDDAGFVEAYGYDSEKAGFANLFSKKTANEKLKAVSFYTLYTDTTYQVYYIDDFDTVKDFERKEAITSGKIINPGYHTIDFDPIQLSSAGKFAVVVMVYAPGVDKPVACEVRTDYTSSAQSGYAESYLSADGENWSDFGQWVKDGNVCLKAFTISQ